LLCRSDVSSELVPQSHPTYDRGYIICGVGMHTYG
jgi:hypothetical protein